MSLFLTDRSSSSFCFVRRIRGFLWVRSGSGNPPSGSRKASSGSGNLSSRSGTPSSGSGKPSVGPGIPSSGSWNLPITFSFFHIESEEEDFLDDAGFFLPFGSPSTSIGTTVLYGQGVLTHFYSYYMGQDFLTIQYVLVINLTAYIENRIQNVKHPSTRRKIRIRKNFDSDLSGK